MALRAEPVTPVCTGHGEGVMWDTAAGLVRFVDGAAGALLALDPGSGRLERLDLGGFTAALRPRRGGGLVVAVERGFLLLDADGTRHESGELWSDPTIRFNDGGCDALGRFLCGSMSYSLVPGAGSLYRLHPDGRAERVDAGYTVPNGLWFSPAGDRAYHADSGRGLVEEVEVDPATGDLGRRRPLIRVPERVGVPDGLTVDAEGGIWVAIWGGSAVHRYTADGVLDAVLPVPARQASCPGFGGPDLDQLYVTSSRQGLAPGEDPLAGAVFRADVGVRGLPVLDFAG